MTTTACTASTTTTTTVGQAGGPAGAKQIVFFFSSPKCSLVRVACHNALVYVRFLAPIAVAKSAQTVRRQGDLLGQLSVDLSAQLSVDLLVLLLADQ